MIHDEQMEKIFANHIATVKQLDDDTQILTWKEQGTRFYELDYVFYRNMVFITGDLRDAVFNCTWQPRWDTEWDKMSLSYFAEKMTAHKGGEYTWDSDDAVEDLKSEYKEYFEGLSKTEIDELTEYVKHEQGCYYFKEIEEEDDLHKLPYHDRVDNNILLQYSLAIGCAVRSGTESEYVYNIQNESNFEDFNDFWEWGYKCGKRLDNDIKWYLVGLQMAYKQLKKVKNHGSIKI